MIRRPNLKTILNMDEMRHAAKSLPRSQFDFIDGGAADELTVRENRAAFDRIWLRPRALADVATIDPSTTVFGQRLSMPLMLDPCGAVHRFNGRGELAAALAAGKAGTVYVVYNGSQYPIEVLSEAAPGSLWAQIYLPPDRDTAQSILTRLARSDVEVLCLTIDNPVSGKRERNYRNRLTSEDPLAPRRIRSRLIRDGIRHPRWAVDNLRGRLERQQLYTADRQPHVDFAHAKPVTAADVQFLRQQWKGKLVIKGIQRGDECDQLLRLGVDGLIVSNHGGRHLDTARATIDALPEVVGAVAGRVDVLLDGGVRRGTDVVKALALGAKAVLIGRPYVFGLAVAGEAGVSRVLDIFRREIELAMALAGCPTVPDIDRSIVTAAALAGGLATPAVTAASVRPSS